MINSDFRLYNFYTLGEIDEYGQQKMDDTVKGSVKMAIYPTSQNVQQNILYLNAQYIGFTHDKEINDTYFIDYENYKLKVLYINRSGRLYQVFMSKVG